MIKRFSYIVLIAVCIFMSCKKAYEPAVIQTSNRWLVVEGVINTAPGGITRISLSHSGNLNDSVSFDPDLNAAISIESESGALFPLISSGNGKYVSSPLSLTANQKYRLRITSEGKEYLSDFILPHNNPEIDSVSWERNEDVFTYVNTHDPLNNTRYYRWEYEETFEYRALYNAIWGLDGRKIILYDSTNQKYQCWMTQASSDIILGSTIQLAQDVISKMPLTTIRKNTEPLYYKYSLLVRQYSLTEAENQFWEILKKNTQQLGTLFDPQPSLLKSNFHCVSDPQEPVIGYLGACPIREKRLFIDHMEVPGWPASIANANCEVITVPVNPIDYSIWDHNPPYAPYYFITGGGLAITLAGCVDCTLRGGANRKPSFW